MRPEKLVSAHVEGDNGEGVRGSAAFLDLARDPEIVELVSGVIGDDVILWGCHVFCKPAGEGYETPWHQDGHYWPIRPLANCTVWVALEESTVENGCLRVIPRSHAGKQLHEHLHEDRNDLTLNQRLADGTFDEASAVDLRTAAGPDVAARRLHDPRRGSQPLGQAPHRRRAALHAVDFGVRARTAPGRRQDRRAGQLRAPAAVAGAAAWTAAGATTSTSGTAADGCAEAAPQIR